MEAGNGMKKISKGYYIIAVLLLVWAAINFYDYAVIGKDLVSYYSGENIILKLVNNVLIEGIAKALVAVVVLGIGFFRAKGRKEQ